MTEKNLLYVQTSGVKTPERLYSPLVLAQTATAMRIKAAVYFLGMGITVVKKERQIRSKWELSRF